MEDFNFSNTLDRLIGIDSLSEKIMTLNKEEIKYMTNLEKIRESQQLFINGKIKQTQFQYLCPSNDNTYFFLNLNRKELCQQLEKDHLEAKLNIANIRKIKQKLIESFINKYKEEEYMYLEEEFKNIIYQYKQQKADMD